MSAYLLYQDQFSLDSGLPNAGGLIYTYEPGTTTPKTAYQDQSLSTAHTNPIELDANGRPPAPIWFDGETKFVVTTSADVAVGPTYDNANLNVPASQQIGQCRLNWSSTSLVKLERYDGRYLFINGAWSEIPSSGVSLAIGSLSASTRYYVYAYLDAGTMTLEAVSTAPAQDSTYGHQIKTGDATRTLVGMVAPNGSTAFEDSATFRGVLSYFNRIPLKLYILAGALTSASAYPASTVVNVKTLSWGDYDISASSTVSNSTTNPAYLGINIDSTTYSGGYVQGAANDTAQLTARALVTSGATVGLLTATLYAGISGGGTATYATGYTYIIGTVRG